MKTSEQANEWMYKNVYKIFEAITNKRSWQWQSNKRNKKNVEKKVQNKRNKRRRTSLFHCLRYENENEEIKCIFFLSSQLVLAPNKRKNYESQSAKTIQLSWRKVFPSFWHTDKLIFLGHNYFWGLLFSLLILAKLSSHHLSRTMNAFHHHDLQSFTWWTASVREKYSMFTRFLLLSFSTQ